MSLHNKPQFNTPEIVSLLIAHGFAHDEPSVVADAFRLGYMAANGDHEVARREDCTCEHGGANCKTFKYSTRNKV